MSGTGGDAGGAPAMGIRFEFRFPDEETARRVHDALRVDDDDFVSTRMDGRVITADVRGSDVMSLKRTVDDLLSCVAAAEGALGGPDAEDADG